MRLLLPCCRAHGLQFNLIDVALLVHYLALLIAVGSLQSDWLIANDALLFVRQDMVRDMSLDRHRASVTHQDSQEIDARGAAETQSYQARQ